MVKEAVLHIPDSSYAFALNEKSVVIRLRSKKDDLLHCTLFYGDRACTDTQFSTKQLAMKKAGSDKLFDYYECELVSGYTRICYYFFLEDEKQQLYYYNNEFHLDSKCNRGEYYQFAYVHRDDIAYIPEWATSSVIYQIFPDSFATDRRWISCQSSTKKDKSGFLCASHNGGTLNGILKNLDYLIDLGINCIYLNPIFDAASYHKYNTIDYFSIDPCFGTEEDLKLLVSTCHKNGLRVLLDGVFNHCGSNFFAFQDVLKNGENSKYVNWFYRLEFPVKYQYPPNYEAFCYEQSMPKLNTGNPEVTEYLCKVGTYWIEKTDIDGWRLDVANEISHDFWRQFRKAVKSVKQDVFLIGEIWENAEQWLQGDQLDSAMNYQFSNLCQSFFAYRNISAKEFDEKIHAMVFRYKTPIAYAQMNLLDSHDVPRFLSRCSGSLEKLKLALFFMMTFIGIPSIFYGNETGIDGVSECEYRKPMPWENQPEQGDLYRFVKELIDVRMKHNALIYGDFLTVTVTEPDVYAFSRTTKTEKLLIVLNNSETERNVKIPLKFSKSISSLYSCKNSKSESTSDQNLKMYAMEGKIFKIADQLQFV